MGPGRVKTCGVVAGLSDLLLEIQFLAQFAP